LCGGTNGIELRLLFEDMEKQENSRRETDRMLRKAVAPKRVGWVQKMSAKETE
jgi:hypothetical protein